MSNKKFVIKHIPTNSHYDEQVGFQHLTYTLYESYEQAEQVLDNIAISNESCKIYRIEGGNKCGRRA